MNYAAQYNRINFNAIPKEISVEFEGIYENTKGFTQYVDLEAQNFDDLIQSMPGAIKKTQSGKTKAVIKQANQLRSKKSTRLQSSKKVAQKRRDLVTPKATIKPRFKVGEVLMHRVYSKVKITSFDWVESRDTYSYGFKTSTSIGSDDESAFSSIVTKLTDKKLIGKKLKVGDYVEIRTDVSTDDYHGKITAYFPDFGGFEILIAEDGGKKYGRVMPGKFLSKSDKESYDSHLKKNKPETTPKKATPAVQQKSAKKSQATSSKASAAGTKKAAATPEMASLVKESKKDLALKKKIEDLKTLVNANRERVKVNAQFKDKIATELRKYLKDNRVINGMSGLADEYAKLKVQDRFYSNLLIGDSADFLIIAKRLGIVNRKGSIKVSEKAKKAVGMSGRGKIKANNGKSKTTKSK